MATRLMLLAYLQEWDGVRLAFRLLAAPQNSPLDPLAPGEPSYTDAAFSFEIRAVKGLGAIPTLSTPFESFTIATAAPPQATAICTALEGTLPIDTSIGPIDPRRPGLQFLKYAPSGYRDATGYSDGRNPYVVTDDRYHCALKAPPPASTPILSDDPELPWGKVMALALRQPLLAETLGLVRVLEIVPTAGFFDDGGWVYVTLTPGSDGSSLLAAPNDLKSYAARVPPLPAARSLFTSVLFPVAAAVPTASYDAVFREAIDYDDGFAKAVYAQQPRQVDPLSEEDDGSRPPSDHGVQLGWDDEQVAIWLNRQIDPSAAVQDAPMGVLGFRVDARVAGDPSWHSLVSGKTELEIGGMDLGTHRGEFRVEVAPNKLMGDTTDTFWIPVYYTTWTGPSLAGPDHVAALLKGVDGPAVIEGVDPDVTLRYGDEYEFRARLVDHTGGGPSIDEEPANPSPQPLAPLRFRRWIRPQTLRVGTRLPVVADPSAPPATIALRRPLLGYPAYVFAGGMVADLVADLPVATAEGRAVGLPDPDVTAVAIEVQVEFPSSEGGFRTISRTTRAFTAGPDDELELELSWGDIKDVTTLPAPPPNGAIPLPTARHVRLVLSALAADKPDYFGEDDVRHGPASQLALLNHGADERSLLRAASAEVIQGVFLQPETLVDNAVALAQTASGKPGLAPDNALGRLAAELDLDVYEVGLRPPPGRRMLFGCSPSLPHVIGPDGGSLQFGAIGDLTNLWLVALQLELDRDWSWDGLAHLSIERDGVEVGHLEPRRTVGYEAVAGAPTDRSELLFIDAIDPKPAAGRFPAELHPEYRVVPVFREAPAQSDGPLEFALTLPVTTPPAQVATLVSVGLALSPYERDEPYSKTGSRQRMAWLEFAAPPDDPADSYFARVLAEAPDPVLTGNGLNLAEAVEPPLPIDPEAIRTVVPGQSDDQAGANAMQALLPTDSPRHFLLPLPRGLTTDSPTLFGFFTYELRVGHSLGWTTAQGRYGRPLRVTGVQHPAPQLACAVVRDRRGLEASAPFADPVLAGRSVRPFPPVTELWVLLYAQIHQADGADMRNILLGQRPAPARRSRSAKLQRTLQVSGGTAKWSHAEINGLLELLALGPDTSLSCLVVETLPGDEPIPDPIGTGLGYERILRTSPLTAIPGLC